MIDIKTFTYKNANGCAIKADAYQMPNGKTQAVILFIHGGALIGGSRKGNSLVIDMLVKAGYTVVSIDYRLAPEAKLADIIQDVQDAFTWLHNEGKALLKIDPDRIGVVGASAGGYLALMCGYLIDPRPKALVSLYGYGDILDSWYTTPSPFYCAQPLISESKARSVLGNQDLSEVTQLSNRMIFYLYCRQKGIWTQEVTGLSPPFDLSRMNRFCPVKNISIDFPPTLLLHGDADTDVPYQQSMLMANKLRESAVECELIILQGKGHRFDELEEDSIVNSALQNMIPFLNKWILC